ASVRWQLFIARVARVCALAIVAEGRHWLVQLDKRASTELRKPAAYSHIDQPRHFQVCNLNSLICRNPVGMVELSLFRNEVAPVQLSRSPPYPFDRCLRFHRLTKPGESAMPLEEFVG